MGAQKLICITSGDPDGIGLEVSLKALLKIGPKKNVVYALFLSDQKLSRFDSALLKRVAKKFRVAEGSLVESFFSEGTSWANLILIRSSLPAARWVEISAKACLDGLAAALCTAPLSKPGIRAAGFRDLGHTEILQRICGSNDAKMCFLGKNFNVVLATGHLPLEEVSAALNEDVLRKTISHLQKLKSQLPASLRKKPIGVLGLNPHAGDERLIGDFEKTKLGPWLDRLRHEGLQIDGPLVPDVAFHPSHWKRYSFYVALYHDQGLIPFKMVHGFDSGVHLTLGLPICRTSVDHGTAKDLYGKGKADSGSMKEAIEWAIELAKMGGWNRSENV